MHFFPLSSTQMMGQGGLSALSWSQDCDNDKLPADPEIMQDLLLQLDSYKSMGSHGIHRRILKELVDVIVKPLLIFEWSRESGELSQLIGSW